MRRGLESNAFFTDCQPQYPDFQGYFNAGFSSVQAAFITIRQLSGLTRHLRAHYSVIEEIVEGFVEDIFDGAFSSQGAASAGISTAAL